MSKEILPMSYAVQRCCRRQTWQWMEHTDFDVSFLDAETTESEMAGGDEMSSGESEGESESAVEDSSGEGGGDDDELGE